MGSAADIRVLHVDDQPNFLEMAAEFLERADDRLVVEGETSADDGLDRLAESTFDCVVSDYDMPGTDGIDFLESVRTRNEELPFILFTGKGSEEIASEAVSGGVTDYMQKEGGSDQFTVLANRIANGVEQYRAEREAERAREHLEDLTGSSTDCLWMFDRDWEELLFISGYEEVWERPEAAIRDNPQDFLNGVHPEDRSFVRDAMAEVSEGESIDIEYRIVKGDEATGWVWVKGDPVLDDEGEVDRVVGFTRDISDRKERERRHEAIIENTDVAIYFKNRDGEYELVNDAFAAMVGRDKDEMIGAHVTDVMAAESAEQSLATDREVIESGKPTTDEVTRSFGGEERVFVSNKFPYRDPDGSIVGVMGVSRDVTSRKERERDLEQYAKIVQTIPESVFIIDPDGVIVDMHGPIAEFTGFEPAELRGKSFLYLVEEGVFPEESIDQWQEGVGHLLDSETTEDYVTYRVDVTPDGDEDRTLEVRLALLSEDDSLEGTVGVARDVTERVTREQELREERDRRNVLFQNPRDAIVEIEFDGETPIVQETNERFQEVFGYEPEEVADEPVADVLVPPEEETQIRHDDIKRRVLDGDTVDTEVRRQTRDGPREFRLRVFPIDILDGHRGSYAIYTDITERKRREKELKRYETVANTASDMVYVLDTDGCFRFVNDAAESLTGYDRDELLGEHVRLLMDEGDIGVGRDLIQQLLAAEESGTSDAFEWQLHTADGESVPCESHITLMETDGELEGTVGVVRDVTDRKEREERLANFNRLVSHDLRNPLSVATGRLELAREERDSEHLELAADALDRIDSLIEDLLVLARRDEPVEDVEPLDVAALAKSCWRNVATADADLSVEADGQILASRPRLQQLFENLVSNAVTHGGEDVTVTVGTTDDGFYVEDDGPGIPEDVDDVFDLGVTTAAEGTGFGLAIVEQVVEAHDWTIRAVDGDDGGARFEIGNVTFAD